MTARTIEFYLDVVSHNAYLAWCKLPALAARHAVDFRTRPVVFGALLKAHGQLGPAEVPPKSNWMIRDVLRKADRLGIEIRPPAFHPFNPLMALRAIVAQPDEPARRRLTDVLFRAAWADGENVADAATLERVLTAAGFNGSDLLQQTGTARVKDALRAATDDALARGVFGVPTMIVDGELFWGLDDFPALEAHLGGKPPPDPERLARWYAVQPGVTRRR